MIATDHGTLAADIVVCSISAFALAAAMLLGERAMAFSSRRLQIVALVAVYAIAGAVTWQCLGPSWPILIAVFFGLGLAAVAWRWFNSISFVGSLVVATQAQFYLACQFWGFSVIVAAEVDTLTRALMALCFALACVYYFIALVERLEQMEIICRHAWRWSRVPTDVIVAPGSRRPKVSLHIPVYAEPPDMVMATLDALAQLDYPDFEVLVVDNNTRDPALWRPVEVHCGRLGGRFRFFHVDELAGAKAGALNFAMRHTAADTELIGVIDSDYQARPNFVTALVGYFDDPSLGFVQTPQAYREWEHDPYLRMCNWEYTLYLVSTLVSRNERVAAITLGTMGMIRRSTLEELGGWAEWCVTEDSELALRVHARGYKSAYVNTTFGRGLIPDSFAGYKRQRFRWSYGAIQELRRHFRLLLPKPLGQTSSLTTTQKLSHLMHAADTMKSGLEFLLLVLGAMLAAALLAHGEAVELPSYPWPTLAVAAALAAVLKWHVFRTLGWSARDTLGAHVAHAALDHTIAMAGLAALLTRDTPWRKTNKFRAVPTGLVALRAVVPELVLGGLTAAAGIALLVGGYVEGLLTLLLIGGLLKSAKYLYAPFLAMLAERGIRQCTTAQRSDHTAGHEHSSRAFGAAPGGGLTVAALYRWGSALGYELVSYVARLSSAHLRAVRNALAVWSLRR